MFWFFADEAGPCLDSNMTLQVLGSIVAYFWDSNAAGLAWMNELETEAMDKAFRIRLEQKYHVIL